MAGYQMSPAEKALASRVNDILVSERCQKIDFSYKGVRISSSAYYYIILSLLGNNVPLFGSKNIKVKVVTQAANTEASYIIGTNTIEIPQQNYGSTTFQKMAIVHESTHAIMDAYGAKFSRPRLENEMLCYIAGALYNIHGSDVWTPGDGIYLEADKVARGIKANRDRFKYEGVYVLDYQKLDGLKNAITNSPTYNGYFSDPKATYGDDGVGLF